MHSGATWLALRFKAALSFVSAKPQLSGVILLFLIGVGYFSLGRLGYYLQMSARRSDCVANRDAIRRMYGESERLVSGAYSLGESFDSLDIDRVREIRDKAKDNFDLCKSLVDNW